MKPGQKLIAAGLGEVLFDHDIETGAYLFGGAPANFAYHFRQCAAFACPDACKVHVVSAIGADSEGDIDAWGGKILDEFYNRGITGVLSGVRGVPTGLVDKCKDAEGKNRYVIHPAAWDRIVWSEELQKLAEGCDVACFGSLAQRDPVSRETIRRFLTEMPSQSLRIFDVNIRQRFYSREVFEASLALCNIVKVSDEELGRFVRCLTGARPKGTAEQICRTLLAQYAHLDMVLLTEGAEGSRVFTRSRTSAYIIPAEGRVKPVDTVGAGDSFTAAFCAMLMAGEDIWAAQCAASRVAAYVCSHHSATPEYPSDPRSAFLVW